MIDPNTVVEVRVDGHIIAHVPGRYAVGVVAECFSTDIDYWSASAITNFLINMFDMSKESSSRPKITKLDRRRTARIYFLDKKGDREGLVKIFYEEILKAYNEGLLPGFGCGKITSSKGGKRGTVSNASINPEKERISLLHITLPGRPLRRFKPKPIKRIRFNGSLIQKEQGC